MATSTTEKVRENRLRRMAHRQGYMLRKSSRRDHLALDYGRYWLDVEGGALSGRTAPPIDWRTGWSLDDVERFLTGGGS